jgi:hypothetical protein
MAVSGALRLKDYPAAMVQLACARCSRVGRYRKAALIEQFGAEIALPDLRHEIAKCERRGQMHDASGIHYLGLTLN